MELRRYLEILRQRWWIALLGLLLGASGAYGFSKSQTPVYQAQATLLLNLAQQAALPTFQDVSASQALTKTYARIITARPTLDEAAQRLGGGLTYKSLGKMSGVDVPETELIVASFPSKDPQFAAKVVNTVSQVFAERVQEAQIGATAGAGTPATVPGSLNTIYVLEPAIAPARPVSPRVTLDTAIGAALGLIAAAAIIALLEYLDDTVKGLADLALYDLTLMGAVQRYQSRHRATLSLLESGTRQESLQVAYQQLYTNIEFARLDGEIRSLVVASAQPGDGKTTTALNLAVVVARGGTRVVLVDTDLRRPSVHRAFDLVNITGVTSALFNASRGGDALPLVQTSEPNLQVLRAGPLPPNAAALLGSEAMLELMRRLRDAADLVIYDSPPSLAVPDAAILAARVDAVLLVVDAGRTRTSALEQALDHLQRSRTRILGVVLNRVGRHEMSYQGYYHSDASYDVSKIPSASSNGTKPDVAPVAPE